MHKWLLTLYLSVNIKTIMKKNVPVIGFIIGLLLPIVGIIIMYFIWFHGTPVNSFFKTMKADTHLAAKVLSMSIIINILPFILYTNKRRDLAARGVFIATMLYAVLIILLKFVW